MLRHFFGCCFLLYDDAGLRMQFLKCVLKPAQLQFRPALPTTQLSNCR
jgi:hypothetical protein